MPHSFSVDDEIAFASRMGQSVGSLGGEFFVSDQGKEATVELGIKGWAAYFAGRCGGLGPVDSSVVTAVCGFFPERFVQRWWEQAITIDVQHAATVYHRATGRWGEQHASAAVDELRLQRAVDLLEHVVEVASPVGAPLFATWRAVPRSGTPIARLFQLLTTAREYRGGLHLAAVLAAGLTPREAILLGSGGERNARFFGWEDITLSESVLAQGESLRSEAERLTDRMVADFWQTLTLEEQMELAGVLTEITEYLQTAARR